jgi:ubiquinone/menaquinone biosynthesis C-methylase UbiE
MNPQSSFWNALAEHHAAIEENFLELSSLRQIMGDVRPPVLVVGAGQGLLVAELMAKGFACDGVDFSAEMIKHAKIRRGLEIVESDAAALPFGEASYQTVIYATGVVDFNSDEEAVGRMLREGRRIVKPGGAILVAFYRVSPALEEFLAKVGLLKGGVVRHRRSLETYLLTGPEMLGWVAKNAGVSWLGAVRLMARLAAFGTFREKATTLKMQRIVRKMSDPQAFIQAATETQPYRKEAEIRGLFGRLDIAVQEVRTLATCWVARV